MNPINLNELTKEANFLLDVEKAIGLHWLSDNEAMIYLVRYAARISQDIKPKRKRAKPVVFGSEVPK